MAALKTKPAAAAGMIPSALAKALAARPEAMALFKKLPPSHRRKYLNWITGAKQEKTAHRRLKQLVPRLLAKTRT